MPAQRRNHRECVHGQLLVQACTTRPIRKGREQPGRPRFKQWDFSALKMMIQVHEPMSLQFRAELFNISTTLISTCLTTT